MYCSSMLYLDFFNFETESLIENTRLVALQQRLELTYLYGLSFSDVSRSWLEKQDGFLWYGVSQLCRMGPETNPYIIVHVHSTESNQ